MRRARMAFSPPCWRGMHRELSVASQSLDTRQTESDKSKHVHPRSCHRFRLAGDAADRAARARSGRLLRDRAVQQSRRGAETRRSPRAIILSGGPASVTECAHAARAAEQFSSSACRCSASATASRRWSQQLGGKVEASHDKREFGRATIEITGQSPLFDGVWALGAKDDVWMSHGDRVTALPPGFHVVGESRQRAVRDHRRREAPILRRDVPSRSGAYAARRRAARAISCRTSPASRPTGT